MALALITGGASGIGAALADRLAARGHDLLLVTRDPGRMHPAARELSGRYGVRADVLTADLATRHGLFRLAALLSGPEAPAVDVLVHDAVSEVAVSKVAGSEVADREQDRIDLGVTATMRLTHAVLPGMLRRGSGAVVAIGAPSGPGGEPVTAWAVSFVSALATTLGGTGVRALAVRPDGRPQWTRSEAEAVLADLDAGRTVSLPGAGPGALRGLPRRAVEAGARAARRSAELVSDATRGPLVPPTAAPAPPEPVAHGPVPSATRRPVPAPGCGRTPEEILTDGEAGPVRLPSRLPDLPARPDAGHRMVATAGCGRSAHYVGGAPRTAEQRARARASAEAAAHGRARRRHTPARTEITGATGDT